MCLAGISEQGVLTNQVPGPWIDSSVDFPPAEIATVDTNPLWIIRIGPSGCADPAAWILSPRVNCCSSPASRMACRRSGPAAAANRLRWLSHCYLPRQARKAAPTAANGPLDAVMTPATSIGVAVFIAMTTYAGRARALSRTRVPVTTSPVPRPLLTSAGTLASLSRAPSVSLAALVASLSFPLAMSLFLAEPGHRRRRATVVAHAMVVETPDLHQAGQRVLLFSNHRSLDHKFE